MGEWCTCSTAENEVRLPEGVAGPDVTHDYANYPFSVPLKADCFVTLMFLSGRCRLALEEHL